MFPTFRVSNPVVYASKIPQDKKKLLTTKKRLQTALKIKIEKVKSRVECDPFANKLTAPCTQMWDEIEELSSALHDVKEKIKKFDDENYMRNVNMLNDYNNKNSSGSIEL